MFGCTVAACFVRVHEFGRAFGVILRKIHGLAPIGWLHCFQLRLGWSFRGRDFSGHDQTRKGAMEMWRKSQRFPKIQRKNLFDEKERNQLIDRRFAYKRDGALSDGRAGGRGGARLKVTTGYRR